MTTSEIRPKCTNECNEARESTKEEFHKKTEGLFKIFQNYLKEWLYEGASSVIHPLMSRICTLLDSLGISPPKEMEKPPQEKLDNFLENAASVVAEKASQSFKSSVDTSGDASIHSYCSVSDSTNRS